MLDVEDVEAVGLIVLVETSSAFEHFGTTGELLEHSARLLRRNIL
jgi:hypothetical protein